MTSDPQTLEQIHTWATVLGFLLAMVTALAGAFYARMRTARTEQRTEDRITALEEWQEKHTAVADEGMEKLHRLQSGMSEGASAGIGRLERSIEKVLQATADNAGHLAKLSGTVEALAGSVHVLVSKGMKGGTR